MSSTMSIVPSSTINSMFTKKFLRDVNTNPVLISLMKKINHNDFYTNISESNISEFVDFVYNFIDYNKLIKSPHASEWNGLSIKHNGNEDENEIHLKKQISDILMNVFTKKPYGKKIDNTFDSFIKRIICNVIGDVCGGFKITDLRPPCEKQVDAMQYIRDNKHKHMREYVTKQLFKDPQGGLVVCLENDHGCVFSAKDTIKSDLTNAVYVRNTDDFSKIDKNTICYLQLDPTVHTANQAKGIYYTGNYSISEVNCDQIKQKMFDCGFKEQGSKLYRYKDRVSVCCVHNIEETDKIKESFWYKKKYLIIVHNKSVGTKKDINKNAEEYAFMRKLIDSYATYTEGTGTTKVNGQYSTYVHSRNYPEDVLVLGDFNLPLWGEDNGYLKLNLEDRHTYPIQEMYEGDNDVFMTKNLELYSTWDNDEIGFKDRTSDWMQNSQAGCGKRTIPEDGPRNYHTDMIFGNIKLSDDWGPVIINSNLYPNPNAATGVAFPMIGPDMNWFSDHQSMEMTMSDNRGEDVAFRLVVLNTLSDCCSGEQHFKRSLNKKTIEKLREEFAVLLSEYISNCVTFTNDVNDKHLELIISSNTPQIKNNPTVKNSVNKYSSTVSLRDIVSENEYKILKYLSIGFILNYIIWYSFIFIKILNITSSE